MFHVYYCKQLIQQQKENSIINARIQQLMQFLQYFKHESRVSTIEKLKARFLTKHLTTLMKVLKSSLP